MEKSKVNRAGFSLLEILVVVVVIALLLTLVVGGLFKARQRAERSVAQQELNAVAALLENYYNDLHAYPDSTPAGIITSGSVALAEGLVGWQPFAEDGAGVANGDPTDYGFRLQPGGRGRIFGPYLLPTGKNYDPVRHVVLDHWGNPILYYRAVPATTGRVTRSVTRVFGTTADGVFVAGDNTAAGNPAVSAAFLSLVGDANGNNTIDAGEMIANRDAYLLVSAGPDGVYFTADDLINTK